MPVRVITLEREYGSGGANIAKQIAERLQWKLWDENITAEIARAANVEPEVTQRCDERVDPLLYRLFKAYARGSYERALNFSDHQSFDTDRMVAMLHTVIDDIASRGNCVIVGRGSPYILRNRPDAFHVFVYAPAEEKIRRLKSIGKSEREAMQLVEEVDRDRSDFIRHYFKKERPCRGLYNVMINTKFGDEFVVESILSDVKALEEHHEFSQVIPQHA
jgi:cytidylate kinase